MTDEFDIIHRFFAPLTRGNANALGLTDDAARLPPRAGFEHIITTDAIVAGVHFLEDETPANVAARLCASNLSDLAAMGAAPVGFTLAAAWTKGTEESYIEAFAAGIGEWVDEYDFPLLGGDTVSTPGPMMFSLTAIGEVEAGRALKRSGARPGDTVYVSGTIGDGGLGLLAAKGELQGLGKEHNAFLSGRFRRPTPRISLGRSLTGVASACIDISDGLVQDLGHICQTSGVSMRIEASAVPLSDAALAALQTDSNLLDLILSGGDDYELAFTTDKTPHHADTELTAIGVVTADVESKGMDGVSLIDTDGNPLDVARGGYNHFAE
ncbi:thiamine-phosphate kinase [Thalassospiraceae bacterium LMO-JJ14]|nr:thiamine-phosphate kinase [Thalassospiraceae bacterium LMO-JJ14]